MSRFALKIFIVFSPFITTKFIKNKIQTVASYKNGAPAAENQLPELLIHRRLELTVRTGIRCFDRSVLFTASVVLLHFFAAVVLAASG